MIWVALLLGIFLGFLVHEVTGFILLHPMATVDHLKEENTRLKTALGKLSEANDAIMGAARLQMQLALDADEKLVAALAEAAVRGTIERCNQCGSWLAGQNVADAGAQSGDNDGKA